MIPNVFVAQIYDKVEWNYCTVGQTYFECKIKDRRQCYSDCAD